MSTQTKRKVTFALVMGLVTTGIVSFALIAINIGFSQRFAMVWLKAWLIGYVLAVPAILLIAPRLQALVDRLVP
jgi:hypothetical protein